MLADADHIRSPEYRNYDNISAIFPTYVNPVSITDEYEFKQEIGRGSYSVVYLAVHTASKMEYAVKVKCSLLCNVEKFVQSVALKSDTKERRRKMAK